MRTVIVGGGVVGLTTAYEIARAGGQPLVLEAARAGQAASHGNAAKIALAESAPVPAPGVLLQGIRWMLRPDSPLAIHPRLAPDYVKFLLAMARHCNARDFEAGLDVHLRMGADANDLLDDYRADGIDFEMHANGVLLAFETRERFEEHCASLPQFESFGHVPERLYGHGAVQEREPALKDSIGYGLFFPSDRQLEPDSLTRGLVARITELGGEVREDTAVSGFVRRGDRVTAVLTDSGERIEADAVVITAGADAGRLTAQLGVPLPIVTGKGYSIDYTPAPVQLRTSLTLEDARVAVTPLDGRLRLAGTMEFGARNNEVNDVRVSAIRRAAAQAFSGWESADLTGEQAPWAGVRPMTPDGLPVIGLLGELSNTVVSSGHSMLGLTLAPASARIASDLVFGHRPELPADLLNRISPHRYPAGPRHRAL
ncbi:FAD-dependent oxidoreductase [Brevibacterium album]|uniref:FAD-dependent oxidoreductase n=1 Tax=Brevibacterium album TaxID=417948 RepID=UPI0004000B48|nr:FAD-dependent oxidoreductase [Brevibacterium album]